MLHRFDVGTLENVEKTPQGGLRVAAHLTRTGVFKYDDGNGGQVSEYRPPEEVFHADSLATIPDATVTVGHPGIVTPDNHSQHAVGHIRDVRKDGDRVAATMVIQGRKAIRAVEKGVRQVSCGYTCRVDETPGVTPDGIPYDRVQRGIRVNHVALVDVGRAGPDVRLRLDAAGNQTTREETMEFERIDGVRHEIGSDAHKDALSRYEKSEQERKQKFDELTAAQVKLSADLEVAKADKIRLDGEVAQLKDPARLDAAVQLRAQLVEGAKKILGADAKFDGLADLEIKRQVAAKAYPSAKFDVKESVRIDAFYEAAMTTVADTESRLDAAAQKTNAVRAAIVAPLASGAPDLRFDADLSFEKMVAKDRDAWKQPLATSVGK